MAFHIRMVRISELLDMRDRISFPDFQRQSGLWSTYRRNLLVQSILEGIDLPKFYFVERDGMLECIDGRQRLSAIMGYVDLEHRNRDGRHFDELSERERDAFKSTQLTFSIVRNASSAQLRQVFVRLQLGLALSTGEKLGAEEGALSEFASVVSKMDFFDQVGSATVLTASK